jgi:hypothetical protein
LFKLNSSAFNTGTPVHIDITDDLNDTPDLTAGLGVYRNGVIDRYVGVVAGNK